MGRGDVKPFELFLRHTKRDNGRSVSLGKILSSLLDPPFLLLLQFQEPVLHQLSSYLSCSKIAARTFFYKTEQLSVDLI